MLPNLHIGFSRGRSGGLVFPSLSEFSTVYCDPHSQRLWHNTNHKNIYFWHTIFLVFFGIWTLIKKYVFPIPSYCENPWQYKQMHWLAFNSDTRLSEIIALRKCEFFHSSSFNYKYLICFSFYCWLSYQSVLFFIWLNTVHLRNPLFGKVYSASEERNKLKVWVIFVFQFISL